MSVQIRNPELVRLLAAEFVRRREVSVAAGKTLTINHSLTLDGADGRTLTIPATGIAALLGTAQTFTAAQTFQPVSGRAVDVQGASGSDIARFRTAAGNVVSAINQYGNAESRFVSAVDSFNLVSITAGNSKYFDVTNLKAFSNYVLIVHLVVNSTTSNTTAYRRYEVGIRVNSGDVIGGYTPSSTPSPAAEFGTLANLTFTLSSPADGTVRVTIGNASANTMQYFGIRVEVIRGYTSVASSNAPRIIY